MLLQSFPSLKTCVENKYSLCRETNSTISFPRLQIPSASIPRSKPPSSALSHPCQRPRLFTNFQTHGKLLAVQLHPGFPTSLSLNQRHRMWSSPLSHSNSSNLLGIISSSDSSSENWRLQVISLPSCPIDHSVLASIQEKHLSKGICPSGLADTKTTGYLILGEHILMATTQDERPKGLTSTLSSAGPAWVISESKKDVWPLLTLISPAMRLS